LELISTMLFHKEYKIINHTFTRNKSIKTQFKLYTNIVNKTKSIKTQFKLHTNIVSIIINLMIQYLYLYLLECDYYDNVIFVVYNYFN